MESKEIIKDISKSNILSMIYSDLAQPSVKKVGDALSTVFECGTTFLLPLKYWTEKKKLLFEKNLNDYKKKLDEVSEEKICDVNPQIGVPIIEKLTYITNDEIADLFTSLLAKASNLDTINNAHPSFINLIERLSVDEARILKYISSKDTTLPSITLKGYLNVNNEPGVVDVIKNTTLIPFEVNLIFPQNINVYLDNLICLGILEHHNVKKIILKEQYDSIIKNLSNTFDIYNSFNIYNRFDYEKGCFEITDYGKEFLKVIK